MEAYIQSKQAWAEITYFYSVGISPNILQLLGGNRYKRSTVYALHGLAKNFPDFNHYCAPITHRDPLLRIQSYRGSCSLNLLYFASRGFLAQDTVLTLQALVEIYALYSASEIDQQVSSSAFDINLCAKLIGMLQAKSLFPAPCSVCSRPHIHSASRDLICPHCGDPAQGKTQAKWPPTPRHLVSIDKNHSPILDRQNNETYIFYLLCKGFSPCSIIDHCHGQVNRSLIYRVAKFNKALLRSLNPGPTDGAKTSALPLGYSNNPEAYLTTLKQQSSLHLLIMCAHFYLGKNRHFDLDDIALIYQLYANIEQQSNAEAQLFSINLALVFIKDFVAGDIPILTCESCDLPYTNHHRAPSDSGCPNCGAVRSSVTFYKLKARKVS